MVHAYGLPENVLLVCWESVNYCNDFIGRMVPLNKYLIHVSVKL